MSVSYTILIIDDEPNLRRTLGLILQQAGYAVTTAGNKDEIYRCLEAGQYDLIFLDLQMPDVRGIELLPQIRQLYPETPVLILTAHASLESAMAAVKQGARDYLLKPLNPAQILKRVEELTDELEQPRRRREIMSQVQDLLSELRDLGDSISAEGTDEDKVANNGKSRLLQRGDFTLDLHTRRVTLNGQEVSLSPTAFDYLVTLLRHSPNSVSYETLVLEAQGYAASRIEAREMVRWRIHELRKSIEPNPQHPRYIITERNVGYRLAT